MGKKNGLSRYLFRKGDTFYVRMAIRRRQEEPYLRDDGLPAGLGLQWREQRRGFYTKWEVDLLTIAAAFCREETGWLRQQPGIGDHLREIEGLITRQDIDEARGNWAAACERMYRHARRRIKEIGRVARIHRDPFEPILSVLEAPSPVGEYRKITEEILCRMPDERRQPRAAAEAGCPALRPLPAARQGRDRRPHPQQGLGGGLR